MACLEHCVAAFVFGAMVAYIGYKAYKREL